MCVSDACICPGCATQVVVDGPTSLYWEQRGPDDAGRFTIAWVPSTYGGDEVVVHECAERMTP